MSWYREADKQKDLAYSPPTVTEQKLDASGNYVTPGAPMDPNAGKITLGGSGVLP